MYQIAIAKRNARGDLCLILLIWLNRVCERMFVVRMRMHRNESVCVCLTFTVLVYLSLSEPWDL